MEKLNKKITNCKKCPRLVHFREKIASEKRKQYQNETYWGKPITGFGDVDGKLLFVGLAPAAHGGTRTGRVFTGDRSSDFLLSLELLENVVDFSLKELKPGGNMVSKYFRSGDISEVIVTCKKHFKKVTSFKPKSSRKESSEIYLVCLEKKSPID